jgi:hypothetical protein
MAIRTIHIRESDNSAVIELNDSFHPNHVLSTFGFHTTNTIPERNRTVVLGITEGVTGLEAQVANIRDTYSRRYLPIKYNRSDAIALNGLNILGYFPVLGLIPCGLRLIAPLSNQDNAMHHEPTAVKAAHYVRGLIEGLGLGAAYVIPDILVTLHRFI